MAKSCRVNRFPDLSQDSGDLDSGCSSDPDPTPLKSPYDPVFNLDSNPDTETDLHLHLNTNADVHPDPVLMLVSAIHLLRRHYLMLIKLAQWTLFCPFAVGRLRMQYVLVAPPAWI
ncbi:hypothetical protein EVAR_32380_1 [Eumeta japonica]|uniref:Uncharacterized protein n=1 Tax=Eumeta variegata TaxID=151549 RepID=A0A4C1VLX6_EUMVA|nr:hypothetical protein EVAR_32380_1 [Eumeta japonica]